MTYRLVEATTVHEGWGKLVVAVIRAPDGRTIKREIEDHGAAVAVLPYDPGRRVALLVRQFRAAVFVAGGGEEMLEAPAGLLEEEDPATCARREALEETGLALRDLEPVGAVWTMPGISTERTHLFLAPFAPADKVAEGGGVSDEQEDITLVEAKLSDLAAKADAGELLDLKLLLLVQTLRLRRPELF
ncbi:MAG TPA: NUDIX hydrolase [Beijerinckiaceae bacterium]|nr:NUDIX hydrolase [Beijerinckiaceae bacterium]